MSFVMISISGFLLREKGREGWEGMTHPAVLVQVLT